MARDRRRASIYVPETGEYVDIDDHRPFRADHDVDPEYLKPGGGARRCGERAEIGRHVERLRRGVRPSRPFFQKTEADPSCHVELAIHPVIRDVLFDKVGAGKWPFAR